MFVQMFTGKVSDAQAVKAHLDSWREGAGREVEGWLGTTAGVTEDGRLIVLARFASKEVAQANSDRPEQGRWWEQMEALFDGEPEFFESDDLEMDVPGDPDRAGFVQVIQGKVTDTARMRELASQRPADWAAYRPDILGTVSLDHGDGSYTMAIWFTSEAEARVGEKKEPPPELMGQLQEMESLNDGEVTFYDLKDPWIYS